VSRDYSKVAPQFWTGPTGKALRSAGPEALVVGCYFMTCPSANMIGLYYVPLPVICHETGIPSEGASKVLRRVSATGFAQYDDETETVWVPEMARFQIDDTLKPGDLRIKGIVRELAAVRKCKFSRDFYEKYRAPFKLPELSWWGGDVEILGRPLEGPSEALRSQEQEQEQEQEGANPFPLASGSVGASTRRCRCPRSRR
jgi:hypothetical protein